MRFFQTADSKTLFFQRLILGLVMFPHGMQKLFGWFGGYGFGGTVQGMSQGGLPAFLVVLVILAEGLGCLGLMFGFLTRFAAAGISAVMLGAIFTVHLHNGFFMNWMGTQPGEGFEYHLLALALSLPLIVKGAGAFSIDRAIAESRHHRPLRPSSSVA